MGFCNVEVKPLGPDQENVTPATGELPVRTRSVPKQTGLLLLTNGGGGSGVTATVTGMGKLLHPAVVPTTE